MASVVEEGIDELQGPHVAAGEIRSGKLAGRSMWSAIWIVAVPVLLQQTMAATIGLVDTILAGHLPAPMKLPALDAISIGSYVTWFVGLAMTGLGIGGQAIIARAVGAGDLAESHRALGNSLSLSLIWGVLVGLLMWNAAPALGALCRLAPDARGFFIVYVRIIACALPMAGIMQVGTMCLHGAGETTMPSLIAVAVNVVNILLAWALSGVEVSYGSWTLPNPVTLDWGVAGIGAGTAISYVTGAVLTLLVMRRGIRDIRLEPADLRLERRMTLRVVRIGVPGFLDSFAMWFANLFVLLIIGVIATAHGLGGEAEKGLQGAHLIAIRWESFSFLPGFAMGTAAGALAGQYLGAGNPRMARRAILACTGVACVIMGALGVVFMRFGYALTRVVSDEPVHLREVPTLLLIAGCVQVAFAVTLVVRQGLRGAGDTTWMFVVTTVSSWGVRLPAAYLLGVTAGLGLPGVWLGLCGEIVVRGALSVARFAWGRWEQLKV